MWPIKQLPQSSHLLQTLAPKSLISTAYWGREQRRTGRPTNRRHSPRWCRSPAGRGCEGRVRKNPTPPLTRRQVELRSILSSFVSVKLTWLQSLKHKALWCHTAVIHCITHMWSLLLDLGGQFYKFFSLSPYRGNVNMSVVSIQKLVLI